ncbi:MAG: hypothetical protein EOP86_20800, partial [Verrucomicrobiaceae bacterium]
PSLLLRTVAVLLFPLTGGAQQIHTSRPSPKLLPLPQGGDVFHFIVFGDRTGGPPEGLEVLRQAVTDTNLLNPDLVMNVGDMVPGYGGEEKWLADFADYRGIMDQLHMPWFPVAGNHDIYWRGSKRPRGEHEGNFEKHIGPLWYWFEHKKCGFVVLFTDEGNGTSAMRDFTRPDNQQMSTVQMDWLRKTLEETKGLEHVFVFLHHPRWVENTYPDSNWTDVHKILAGAGNVRAVFAGHVHRLRYDGNRDGIEYITLGTTGGAMPGNSPEAGFLHHMNLVTVRRDGAKVAVIPVGEVMDPKQFTPELIDAVNKVKNTPFELTPSPIAIDETGLGAGLMEFKITNPVPFPVELTLVPDLAGGEWISSSDHLHLVLPPKQSWQNTFTVLRTRKGFDDGFTVPAIELQADILMPGRRVPLPPRRVTLPVTLKNLGAGYFQADTGKAIQFNGREAIRVEMGDKTLPEGPFTVEAWVKPSSADVSGDIVSKAEQSEFALNLTTNVPGFHAHLNGKYESAIATTGLPMGQWSHIAGVFDGSRMTLYVNGKPEAFREATGPRAVNPLPLYIGANPDALSKPSQFLDSGAIDEVRLSRTARYSAAFQPEKRFQRDENTVYLFHCDQLLGPFLPSDTDPPAYGTADPVPTLIDVR